MNSKIDTYIATHTEELTQLLRDLCRIPAPSNHEKARADFCKAWLERNGASGVYIDEALNVVFPLNCENSKRITVFVAHTDTVFPDTEPYPYEEDEQYIRCPGVGDDTASVAILMMTVKFFVENDIKPENGFLFVCNSGEEGLGNLKGTRQIFADYADRIETFIALDCTLGKIYNECAGSHRYKVTVRTEGGHSFQKFGNKNALVELSKIVTAIGDIEVPQKPNTRTTHNIGTMSGGTSVNTIAQEATMLCEYRSTDAECLAYMRDKFMQIFENARSEKVDVQVIQVGDRPCSRIDPEREAELADRMKQCLQPLMEEEILFKSASTDCNIPLSMGIPALCIGVYRGAGAHTREEWLEKASLPTGLRVTMAAALELTR